MKKILLLLIFLYQKAISPYLKPSCRYIPSCSEYAKQAVIKYGAIKGSFLAIYRVLRCNPLAKKIYDPLP
ncbi:membrane protein insertion efficiency factor YidD [Brachyspira sp.]|uniref:membrane protein insertion efficiency factor YidD n=1 Tax=Brachyspira sp. TaxID=1977261 RepID=UPI002639CF93|nr:membrane protein insertion efficiency factor YidD [Brachyspira sp.]